MEVLASHLEDKAAGFPNHEIRWPGTPPRSAHVVTGVELQSRLPNKTGSGAIPLDHSSAVYLVAANAEMATHTRTRHPKYLPLQPALTLAQAAGPQSISGSRAEGWTAAEIRRVIVRRSRRADRASGHTHRCPRGRAGDASGAWRSNGAGARQPNHSQRHAHAQRPAFLSSLFGACHARHSSLCR